MSRTTALLKYKLLFFFGPSFRGKWGPAPLLALELLFATYGFAAGYGVGTLLKTASADAAVNLLGTVMAGLVSIGFLYSLGSGFTASPSELDFVMTTQIRPREFLVSDMLFQFFSLGISGGLSALLALFGLVAAGGENAALLPLLLVVVLAYVFIVLMIVQILVILRIRYPNARVRIWTVLLLFLSLLPAVSLASTSFPLHFQGLPIPQTSFAVLVHDILVGSTPAIVTLLTCVVYFAAVALIWLVVSNTYIFHGVQPTLSAGFGQINLSSKQAQQRRIIRGLGRVTTRIVLRTDVGSDTGFMTRFHLVRVLRDGSLLFVGLLIALAIVPSYFAGGTTPQGGQTSGSVQILSLPIGILALNWGYYESANLWLVATAGRSLMNYFRGMMLGIAAFVIVVAGTLVVVLQLASGVSLKVEDLVYPIVSPIAASIAATALLTRLKIMPGAFSPIVLVLIFVTVIVGYASGFVASAFVGSGTSTLGILAQLTRLAIFAALLTAFGMWAVGQLAKGYKVYD